MRSISAAREGRRLHRQLPAFRNPTIDTPPPDDPCHMRDQKVKLWPEEFARIRAFMMKAGKRSQAAAVRALIQKGLEAHGI